MEDMTTWLGFFRQTTEENESTKFVHLDKTSETKCRPDLYKYENARKLCENVGLVRKDYMRKLKNKGETASDLQKRQIGCCAYFIDKLALRVGGEKNTDEEADTVGCCSLKVKNISMVINEYQDQQTGETKYDRVITLDFLGKDSIRYLNTIKVPQIVYDNLARFQLKKKMDDELFDLVVPTQMNRYLSEFQYGLSAKVFRTFNASWTLEQQLKTITQRKDIDPNNPTQVGDFYNECNKKVAILCNHQKAASKSHAESVKKEEEKLTQMMQRVRAARALMYHHKVKDKKAEHPERIQHLLSEQEFESYHQILGGSGRIDSEDKAMKCLMKHADMVQRTSLKLGK